MKVSVVMISYNVARYIGQALESVINQTLKDIEIIVVDKFSNDGTREIIKDYMKKDSRIKLIDDIKGSAGYSYNAGIREARGEYIGFVETDDYVERDMYEKLYDLAVGKDLDFIKGNFYLFVSDDNGKEVNRKHNIFDESWDGLYENVIKSDEYPELPLFDTQMWAGIYRRDYLIDNNVMLNESRGAAFQDHGFQWQALVCADKCMYLKEAFYHYRKDNISASMNNPRALFMDLKELEYIKEKLDTLEDLSEGYWRAFYAKVICILHYRLYQYFAGGGQVSEEINTCVKDYVAMIDQGIKDGFFDEDALDYDSYLEWFKIRESIDGYLNYIRGMALVIVEREKNIISFVEYAKEIVIFGNGENGKDMYWLLYRNGYGDKIAAFCDNNPSMGGSEIESVILPVSVAVKKYPSANYIVANFKSMSLMKRQLISLGIPVNKIHGYRWKLPEWRTI